MRTNKEVKEILMKAWENLPEEERDEFLGELSNKELTLLEDSLWDQKTIGEATKTIWNELFSFRDQETRKVKKGKIVSMTSSAVLSGATAGLLDMGVGGITGGAISGAIVANIVDTVLEEDGATRRLGRAFINTFRRK